MYRTTLALLFAVSAVACAGSESDSNQSSSGDAGAMSGGSSPGGAANTGSGGTTSAGGSVGGSAAGGVAGISGNGGVNAGGYGGMQCTPPQCTQVCEGGSCSCLCEAAAGTGGGSSTDCTSLNTTRQQLLDAARSCTSELAGQCTGSATVPNQCGCPTLVNDARPSDVQAAQDAYDAWLAEGCGPYPCGAECFQGTTGTCAGQGAPSGSCAWVQ